MHTRYMKRLQVILNYDTVADCRYFVRKGLDRSLGQLGFFQTPGLSRGWGARGGLWSLSWGRGLSCQAPDKLKGLLAALLTN